MINTSGVTVHQNTKLITLQNEIAKLVNGYFVGDKKTELTNNNIKAVLKSAYHVIEQHGNIYQEPKIHPVKLTFKELIEYRLYKNVNTYDDQWYMKIRLGKKAELITCSKFSDWTFNSSSASRSMEVFVDFKTELSKR